MMRAIALAAGLGLRLRPLTLTTPKPLVSVAGKTLLDHALDKMAALGVEDCVVNMHHLADKIASHVAGRRKPKITLSDETGQLLETGGGIAKALSFFEGQAFIAANADILWTDAPAAPQALERLRIAWDEDKMDGLLLLVPRPGAFGYEGAGDFFIEADQRLRRKQPGQQAPFVFAGVQILHPNLFDEAPAGAFSLNLLYDKALARGRLFGLIHDGGWYHIGTPEALAQAQELLG
ncbi:MAG: nucleotidyltransferase family protein [Alphaproteobacteria bacterium]|nr:nucleotidyltransferase family protein [Alphaproteobacteria bacterium]